MFKFQGSEPRISYCCRLAESFIRSLVKGEIELVYPKFTHTTHSPEQMIMHLSLQLESTIIPVGTYRTRSNIVGRFYKGRIEYNLNNLLHHSNAFIAGNIVHEAMHFFGYRHKGNFKNRHGNAQSVPYAIGDLAKQWIESQGE
jgi:predicted SprT family Zn-dependent metalloprotease